MKLKIIAIICVLILLGTLGYYFLNQSIPSKAGYTLLDDKTHQTLFLYPNTWTSTVLPAYIVLNPPVKTGMPAADSGITVRLSPLEDQLSFFSANTQDITVGKIPAKVRHLEVTGPNGQVGFSESQFLLKVNKKDVVVQVTPSQKSQISDEVSTLIESLRVKSCIKIIGLNICF